MHCFIFVCICFKHCFLTCYAIRNNRKVMDARLHTSMTNKWPCPHHVRYKILLRGILRFNQNLFKFIYLLCAENQEKDKEYFIHQIWYTYRWITNQKLLWWFLMIQSGNFNSICSFILKWSLTLVTIGSHFRDDPKPWLYILYMLFYIINK